jgi:hypothetical protein
MRRMARAVAGYWSRCLARLGDWAWDMAVDQDRQAPVTSPIASEAELPWWALAAYGVGAAWLRRLVA